MFCPTAMLASAPLTEEQAQVHRYLQSQPGRITLDEIVYGRSLPLGPEIPGIRLPLHQVARALDELESLGLIESVSEGGKPVYRGRTFGG